VSNAFYGTKMLLNADTPAIVDYKTRSIIIAISYFQYDDFNPNWFVLSYSFFFNLG